MGCAVLSAPAFAAPPQRVVSLNLCTDELALELAAPGQLASVTWLAADRHETRLAQRTRGLRLNNGRLDSVADLKPDLVLTSGPANRNAAELARRIGARVVEVPWADTPADVRLSIGQVAAALGREEAGRALTARFDADLGALPERRVTALYLGQGGSAARPGGLAATYLLHAGAQLTGSGGPVAMERLVASPPALVILSTYRAEQTSLGRRWLEHPALARLPSRRVALDGRGWSCLGPEAARAIPELRRALGR
jgi:iron complex transport system substrate-binding protein